MVKVLERMAKENGSKRLLGDKKYLERRDYSCVSKETKSYSTFAEMYLEKPIDSQEGITASICTWRGIPTIDDW